MPARRISAAFACLLVLSVGLKAVAGRWRSALDPAAAQTHAKQRVADFLGRHGFAPDAPDLRPDSPVLAATFGACRLVAIVSAPEGWHDQIARSLAGPDDSVSYVYDGALYRQPPLWASWRHEAWVRASRVVRGDVPSRLLVGLVASPGCDPAALPWAEIAQ